MASTPLLTLEFKPRLEVIQKDLRDLGVDLKSLHEPLKRAVQQVIIPSIRANFDAQGRPPWAPYADSTIEFHQDLGLTMSRSLLNKTGTLKRVATQLNVWSISKEEAKFNGLPQNVWYGNLHQTGGRGGKVGHVGIIPARPFVMFQPQDGDKITEVFAKWLDERIAKRWR